MADVMNSRSTDTTPLQAFGYILIRSRSVAHTHADQSHHAVCRHHSRWPRLGSRMLLTKQVYLLQLKPEYRNRFPKKFKDKSGSGHGSLKFE
eukprot:3827231-Amphidinium_carterae.1